MVDNIVKMLYFNIMDTRLTIEIDSQTKNKFKGKAAGEGKTIKEKLVELINEYLRKED